ncbi:hypothetical protein B0T16DRAFT_214230 [Cercophora newfieldiana]|uniref:Uncharacterized protein n=1 Tax=Cercophora newfieldiana TaxID=92897 RepID=A0AA40CK53_9PEZI|nr:hypothetical protein B0T16DRAFT_214230 [Cercophora newfieldiana]
MGDFWSPRAQQGIDLIWMVGEDREIKWTTTFPTLNIRIWQEDPLRGSATGGETVFVGLEYEANRNSFPWKVQTYEFNVTRSNKYFFWAFNGTDPSLQDLLDIDEQGLQITDAQYQDGHGTPSTAVPRFFPFTHYPLSQHWSSPSQPASIMDSLTFLSPRQAGNYFKYPPADETVTFTVGEEVEIRWSTTFPTFNIILWQRRTKMTASATQTCTKWLSGSRQTTRQRRAAYGTSHQLSTDPERQKGRHAGRSLFPSAVERNELLRAGAMVSAQRGNPSTN